MGDPVLVATVRVTNVTDGCRCRCQPFALVLQTRSSPSTPLGSQRKWLRDNHWKKPHRPNGPCQANRAARRALKEARRRRSWCQNNAVTDPGITFRGRVTCATRRLPAGQRKNFQLKKGKGHLVFRAPHYYIGELDRIESRTGRTGALQNIVCHRRHVRRPVALVRLVHH